MTDYLNELLQYEDHYQVYITVKIKNGLMVLDVSGCMRDKYGNAEYRIRKIFREETVRDKIGCMIRALKTLELRKAEDKLVHRERHVTEPFWTMGGKT